jgi:hypothetical protein
MPTKILIVIDENDHIIEQIPCDGTNSTQQRKLEKETRERYNGQRVKVRCGYKDVPVELVEKTKKLLEEINVKYPGMMEVFSKERPEFTHLGYNIDKKYKR